MTVRVTHFEHGDIYYTPATGAHEVFGAIGQRWADEGFERSPYGYPTGAEFSFGGSMFFGPRLCPVLPARNRPLDEGVRVLHVPLVTRWPG